MNVYSRNGKLVSRQEAEKIDKLRKEGAVKFQGNIKVTPESKEDDSEEDEDSNPTLSDRIDEAFKEPGAR